ncbi:MAG: hypothetical protein ACRELG_14345 [Gemmataceae bacterium]
MTEAEWLACPYPSRMIEGKRGWRRSTRKLRLLTCACYRRVGHLLSDTGRKAIEVAERHADGRATNAELHTAQPAYIRGGNIADNGAHHAAAPNPLFRSWVGSALSYAAWAVEEHGPLHEAERLTQCHVIRDVFGPLRFRPVDLAPVILRWQDFIIPKLAQAVYDDRSFDHLPMLADALEEAGCTNTAVLAHCREPGEHVRGCWVIDLLLGKS